MKTLFVILSLVSGVSESDINKVEIRNAFVDNQMPMYDPYKGGGGMTFPGDDGNFRMNLTDNFFEDKYGANSHNDDADGWLRLSSHEVGHIKDILEIGPNKFKYGATFILGYAVNMGHDANPREERADQGRTEYTRFKSFVDNSYGEGTFESVFTDQKTSQKSKVARIDNWWSAYQKQKSSESTKKETSSTP